MNKIKNLVVITSEYIDRQGNPKKNYKTIGAIWEKNGNEFILIDRTFNPAGLPNPENKDSILISMYEPKSKSDDDIPF